MWLSCEPRAPNVGSHCTLREAQCFSEVFVVATFCVEREILPRRPPVCVFLRTCKSAECKFQCVTYFLDPLRTPRQMAALRAREKPRDLNLYAMCDSSLCPCRPTGRSQEFLEGRNERQAWFSVYFLQGLAPNHTIPCTKSMVLIPAGFFFVWASN